MGIGDFVGDGVSEMAIARPDDSKDQVVYKHPDETVPMKARLTVDSDEVALFFRDGEFERLLGAGRHVLDSDTLPFLGQIVDKFTEGDVFQAEVFFVSLNEFTNFKFGGRIGEIRDPESGLPAELRVHGSFALQVEEPRQLVVGLTGMGNFEQEGFAGWFQEQVLKTIRDDIAELCVKQEWPLLDVTSGAYTEEIEEEVLEGVGEHCEDYGIEIVRLGNFHVSIDDEAKAELREIYKKSSLMDMAGGDVQDYDQLASAEAKMGAAEGLADGDGDSSLSQGAGLGMGAAMGQQIAGNSGQAGGGQQQAGGQQQPRQNAPGGGGSESDADSSEPDEVTCPSCSTPVPDGSFCSSCGSELPDQKYCSGCGAEVSASANFCSECGTEIP